MSRGFDPWIVLGVTFVATNFVGVSPTRTSYGKAPGLPSASPPPPPPLTQSIGDFHTSVTQQNLQSVLIAIEQRLRGLDNLYATRYGVSGGTIPGTTIGWEALDSRLNRLETTYDRRLEAISESCSSKNNLILHKVDRIYERIRLMETGQNTVQVAATRTSEKQTNIADRVDNISKTVARIEQQLIRTNGTLYALERRLQEVSVSIEALNNPPTVQTVASEGPCSLNSSDIMNEIEGAVTTIREHIDRKADLVLDKATNLYNNVWRHVTSAESLVKATLSVANATKLQLQEVLSEPPAAPSTRTFPRSRSTLLTFPQPDNAQLESLVDALAQHITRNMDLLDRRSDERFREIQNSVEAFQEKWSDPQSGLEARITRVLDKLLDYFGEKNEDVDKRLLALKDLLKYHDNHVTNIIARTAKVVQNASEMSDERDKNLQEKIAQLSLSASEDSQQIQQKIEQALLTTNGSNSRPEIISLISGIATAVQGLREQIDCFNSSCTLHSLLKNMSSELEKAFVSSCGRSGAFSEKYNVSYDEAWAFILGKKNSTEQENLTPDAVDTDNHTENPSENLDTVHNDTDVQNDNEQTQNSGRDGGLFLAFDLTPLEEDDYNDDDDGSEVNY